MNKNRVVIAAILCFVFASLPSIALAAYHHAGDAEKDAAYVLQVYPKLAGTKLDNCALCHTGGTVTGSNGKKTTYGSCQWCHLTYKYDGSGNITATLNSYGKDYLAKGRNAAALTAIEKLDSDGDKYDNITEINAIRYPGDANDDPKKVIAPYRIYTKKQLQAMPQHKQFMLMNTTKSGDYYSEYSGVIMQDLLKRAGISSTATKITVYSPDGFATGHPLNDSSDNTGSAYAPYVNGTYPAATYYYNIEADKKKTSYGWCNYSSAGNKGRTHGDAINVDGGLRLLLAIQADGTDLVPGKLGPDNKLLANSEGPFRTVTPQKIVGPPDQPSTNPTKGSIWQYDANADHNAGFSSKSATIIKVEPLPAGTTDINVNEAGWIYVDEGKLVIYGALDGPTLIYPVNAMGTPVNGTSLVWNKFTDPDPAAIVTYTVEISKDKLAWTTVSTQMASLVKPEKTQFAGAGKFMLFGLIGTIAVGVPRRSRKYLGLVLVIALTGTVLSSCSDSDSSAVGMENVVIPSGTLSANTKYYWRVTADGPNSHAVSEVSEASTFTTTQ
ncbi:MAG: hypothetical protein HXX11_16845 [Desulfuromonadales bacterium]|nr:hypothetical protein [Desulfuromonadales bacterium]